MPTSHKNRWIKLVYNKLKKNKNIKNKQQIEIVLIDLARTPHLSVFEINMC